MGRLDLDRMSLQELLHLEAKIHNARERARERERAKVKREIVALIEKRGFTVQEILGPMSARKLSAPMYANPDDPSQTWIGRGRRPRWLVAKMKKGAKLRQFAL
jgi:DNA-binding protein H-NS